MRNVLIFFLFLCLILALYSHFFLDGEAISFEETYKSALQLVADIGEVFANLKDGVVELVDNFMSWPEKISNFFEDLWHDIVDFFGGEVSCGCVEDCADCLSDFNTITGVVTHVHCGKEEYCNCQYCDAYRGGN